MLGTSGPQWPPGLRTRPIRVHLECGCTAITQALPIPQTRLACPGAGHGYRLRWLSAEHPERADVITNKYAESKERGAAQ